MLIQSWLVWFELCPIRTTHGGVGIAASVGIPNTKFSYVEFSSAPSRATLLADVANFVFGNLPLPNIQPLALRIAANCGQFLSFNQLNLSLQAAESLISGAGGCMLSVVSAAASAGGVGGLSPKQRKMFAGKLGVLARIATISLGINLGAELGDLWLGKSIDSGLRNFSVSHRSDAPTGTTTTAPPTTAAATTTTTTIRQTSTFAPGACQPSRKSLVEALFRHVIP